MNGRHGHSTGLTSNSGHIKPIKAEYSLPGLLTKAGYQTKAVGKMHFVPERCNYGFENMEILEDYYRYMAAHPEKGVPMNHGVAQNEMSPVISTVDETNSLTHWTIDRSIDFLETRDNTRPFFLWTSFAKPHSPFDPCLNYWELYRNAEVPEPVRGDWSEAIEGIPGGFWNPSNCGLPGRYSESQMKDIIRAYYACITQIDYNLGVLFARMREMGLFENTLIIFTSDHGEMLGDHLMGAKAVPFEGAAHIPMIVRKPQKSWDFTDKSRGTSSTDLVCLADVLPTCLGFAGVNIPKEAKVDGIDMLSSAGKEKRKTLFGQSVSCHFVREGVYKYCYEDTTGDELLFDLENDPKEKTDLIRSGGHEKAHKELKQKLTAKLAARKHPAVKSGKLVPAAKAGKQDIVINPWPGFHSRKEPRDVAH
jgi:arylsulfatase A-like enzyme